MAEGFGIAEDVEVGVGGVLGDGFHEQRAVVTAIAEQPEPEVSALA